VIVKSATYFNVIFIFGIDRGVQMPGFIDQETKRYIFIKEMVPEIVVPDLTGFEVNIFLKQIVRFYGKFCFIFVDAFIVCAAKALCVI
jgi:hypothetical protein